MKEKSSSRKLTKSKIQKQIEFFESIPQRTKELFRQRLQIEAQLKNENISATFRNHAEKTLEASEKFSEALVNSYKHYLENRAAYKKLLEYSEMLEKVDVELAETDRELIEGLVKAKKRADRELRFMQKGTSNA